MNWVGGSRNRLVMRNDAKKQREFFEKRRLQQRLRKLGITPPSTPANTAGSTDLMTLFVVNQIATKKATQDPPKVAVFGNFPGRSKHRRDEPLVLPMSPCSPSKLSLVESRTQLSVQGHRKKKNIFQQRFKHQQLSPVQESGFSDNSASDYLPPRNDLPSPPSSTSPASSGQGLFHLQMNPQEQSQTQFQALPQYSPQPWDNSVLQQTKFQPFSKPRFMTDAAWSWKSDSPHFQLKTPTAAQTLFESPFPDQAEERDGGGDASSFFLTQPEDTQPMLDFTCNQADYTHSFKEKVFSVFGNQDQREDSHFGSGNPKIYLRDENSLRSSTPQTVPDPVSVGVEPCNCPSTNPCKFPGHLQACLGGNTEEEVNRRESSPCCSCTTGYLSSDSSDDEPCSDSCQQESASQVDRVCSDNSITSSQWNHQPFQPGPRPPQITPRLKIREDHKVLENIESSYKIQQMGSSETLSSSSGAQTETSEPCKCRKVSAETQEAGTQTEHLWTAETCDASTQYSSAAERQTKASGFSSQPDVDMSQQYPAAEADSEPQSVSASVKISRREETQMSRSKKNSKAGSLAGNEVTHKFPASTGSQVIPCRTTNPLLDFINSRDKEREGGQHKNSVPKKELPNEVKEVRFDGRASGASEDEMLHEVADILLLLKRRRTEE